MTATVVISFDFELGWGYLERDMWRARERDGVYDRLRPVMSSLLDCLLALELPTTWATVSSMHVEDRGSLELEHLPDDYREAVLSFYDSARWSSRCANDLFDDWQRIASFSEMATHTSTHIYDACPGMDSARYVADVESSIGTLERLFSCRINSIVYPRDQSSSRDAIAAALPGLDCRVGPYQATPARGRLERVIDGASAFWRPVPASRFDIGPSGDVAQSGSMYFNAVGGDFQAVKRLLMERQKSRLLSLDESDSDVFHVWLHPFNLAESDAQNASFIGFLQELARMRDNEKLRVLSMHSAARTYRDECSLPDAGAERLV